MNRIDEWTQFISKCLKSETELLGIQSRHDLYQDTARATFIRVVLDQFLPSSFAVGSGRVIDASGNSSNELDIVIYRRDFPQLNLPGSSDVFLYESVLATIEVKTKVVRKTFFEAMDNCASMGALSPAVNPVAIRKLALRNKLYLNENDEFVHEDPLKTARFNLIGRPPTFVYAFSGYQTSLKQLKENIDLWIGHRRQKKLNYEMKSFPSVIATQGCFAWRNAAPLSIKKNFMLGLGNDNAPIRLIILQLMNVLNRRLRGTNEKSGINLNLDAYINNIDPPKFSSGCGKAINPGAATTTVTPVVKDKTSIPAEKKVISTPEKKKAASPPVEKKAEPIPVKQKVEPTPAQKEPVPAPVIEKASEDSSKLETYSVFNPSKTSEEESAQEAILETKATIDPEPVFGSISTQELKIIEPELAKPEFIEPEISEPQPAPESKPEVAPEINLSSRQEPDEDPFEATLIVSPAGAQKIAKPPVNSDPKIELEDKPEPEAEPFESTLVMSALDAQKMTKPAVNSKSKTELEDKPEPEAEAFEATLVMSALDAQKMTKPAVNSKPKIELEDKPELEADSFSDTIRMPARDLENISTPISTTGSVRAKDSNLLAKNGQTRVTESDPDPFSRTIPQ